MSIFAKLFSKFTSEKVPSTQEAIQKLHEFEDVLVKREGVLEKKIEKELLIAKTNGSKNKRGNKIILSNLTESK
jgi:hypothetical protein